MKDTMFIFDDELCVDDKSCEVMDGYLWATDKLVQRMKDRVKSEFPDLTEGDMDNINFYALYHIPKETIEITGTFLYMEKGEEKQHCFDLPLSPNESKTLKTTMDNYCRSRYGVDCLTLLNEIRERANLPAISRGEVRKVPSLLDRIKTAQMRIHKAGEPHIPNKDVER